VVLNFVLTSRCLAFYIPLRDDIGPGYPEAMKPASEEKQISVIPSREGIITDFETAVNAIKEVVAQILINHGINENTPLDELGIFGEEIATLIKKILGNLARLQELVERGRVKKDTRIEYGDRENCLFKILSVGDITITYLMVQRLLEEGEVTESYFIEITEPSPIPENSDRSLTTGIVFNRTFISWFDMYKTKNGSITYYYSEDEEAVLNFYERGSVEPLSSDEWHEESNLFIRDPRWLWD